MHNIARMVARLRLVTLDRVSVKKPWRGNQSKAQCGTALLAACSCNDGFGMLRIGAARRMGFAHVTSYCVVDDVLAYLSNQCGHAKFHVSQGNLQASKFGLFGSKGIGRGTKAILRLDSGFKSLTGARCSGAFYALGRHISGSVVTGMGRSRSVPNHALLPVDRRARGGRRAPCDVDSSDTTLRFNNSVTYLLPNVASARFNAVGGAQGFTEYSP